MKKVGYRVIKTERMNAKPRKCVNCGGKGIFKVMFQDEWGKLIVTLCKDCATKQYEELHLQSRLDWPIRA